MAKGGQASVQIEGGPQLRRALKAWDADLSDLKAATTDVAGMVADRAGDLVPRLSGDLAGTIRGRGNARSAYVQAGGRASVPYAGPIHFGWRARNIEPQPFLYDALDDRRGDIIERYRTAVADTVKAFDRKAPD